MSIQTLFDVPVSDIDNLLDYTLDYIDFMEILDQQIPTPHYYY